MSAASQRPTKHPAAEVRVENFSVRAGRTTLLHDVTVTFPAGAVSLIVGPSGAGKTQFLYALAGLLDDEDEVRAEGRVLIDGRDVSNSSPRPDCGVVFQQFALFDELSARGNVQFAADHAQRCRQPDALDAVSETASGGDGDPEADSGADPGADVGEDSVRDAGTEPTFSPTSKTVSPDASETAPEQLLQILDVPDVRRVTQLSGGQQQRLAVARTLAYRPRVVLYDEPTSGLDAASAARVADLIFDTQRRFGRTSIIVTHDYDSLPGIADAVFVLDRAERTLKPVPRERWRELRAMLSAASPEASSPTPATPETHPTPATQTAEPDDAREAAATAVPSQGGPPAEAARTGELIETADKTAAAAPLSSPAAAAAAERESEAAKHDEPTTRPGFGARVRAAVNAAALHTGWIGEHLLLLLWWLLPVWKRPKWGLRFAAHYARVVCGPSACAYLAITGFLIGFVATYFTFRFFPYGAYAEPLLVENLLHAIGFLLFRVLVPLLGTVLIAARCGAAVASDLGAKTYGRQLHAMRSVGVQPDRYLLTGTLWAFLLGTPILNTVAFTVARLTSGLVFTAMRPQYGAAFWHMHFHWELRLPGQIVYAGSAWLLAKLLVCAVGTALIAYRFGTAKKHSAADVRAGITSTILWATLWVLTTHFAFTFWEFNAYRRS